MGDGKYIEVFDVQVISLAKVAEIVAVMPSHLKPAFLADGLGTLLKRLLSLAVAQRMMMMSMPC